jgi:hypothetical protein
MSRNYVLARGATRRTEEEKVMKRLLKSVCAVVTLACCAWAQKISSAPTANEQATSSEKRPNILFIIMDDVGIDQMKVFGYGGRTAPRTPNFDTIALAGVRFRNAWSMPECSPSRAIFFEGRFPLRTKIYTAILSDDLANSQVSPFEVTTPKLLKTHAYDNALFGKFHLAGPDNNPYGEGTPHALGWQYFDGFLEGAPHPIDTTAGGVAHKGVSYTCGFVPNAKHRNGADRGACYQSNNSCVMLRATLDKPTPGLTCLESGGIFDPNKGCQSPPPPYLNFQNDNGYYVWNRVINKPDGTIIEFPPSNPGARGYNGETIVQSTVNWINEETAQNKSWMATLSFAQDHTPYQQPPGSLLPQHEIDSTGFACTGNKPRNTAALRIISNQMIEAMDHEIGDVLVKTGLAVNNPDGSLDYHPENTNTMVVIIGDNGTFAPGVKVPFDPNRAKGYVNQTGVWVPLIVAGPLVTNPDREVTAMVNIADLFQLFGEMAGIDVRKEVPKSHKLDSVAMLPYLTNPKQRSIRQTNFTQTGNNIHPNLKAPPPCVIPLTNPATCVQIFVNQGICEYEGGVWYGPGAPKEYPSCCAVENAHIYSNLQILPDDQTATRNDVYKLIVKHTPDCSNPGQEVTTKEFFKINEDVPVPKIDHDEENNDDNLCSKAGCPHGLNPEQKMNYFQLLADMRKTLNSEPPCPGDGNEDKKVNDQDVANWLHFNQHNGLSSWYDFNYDGLTNKEDLAVIAQYFGTNCLKK